jgi:hypothetical protein
MSISNSDSSCNNIPPTAPASILKPILKSASKPTFPPEAKRTSHTDTARTTRQDKVLFRPTETESSQTTGTLTTYAEVTAQNVGNDTGKDVATAQPASDTPIKQQIRCKLKITVPANIAYPVCEFV